MRFEFLPSAVRHGRMGNFVSPNPSSRNHFLHLSLRRLFMATYRFEAKVIGRSSGRSATAAAAYRAGQRIDDERTGQSFDYTRRGGVLHAEILAPAGTPDWMRDRSQLWNAVEKAEKRKDAQLARDLVLSLPHELSHEDRRDLVREFVRDEFVSQGMIADIAIHKPDRRGDQRNHHAHVMLTMRELTSAGFGPKAREWNSTDLLEHWRERWAEAVNLHLERNGHSARVDHRSLADQGIDREPEPKQGAIATKMEKEGRTSHAGEDRRGVKERNQERAGIEAELGAIVVELADYAAQKESKRSTEIKQDVGADDGEEEQRRRQAGHPMVATPDAGLVSQQRDAQRRFERNSDELERQRQERLSMIEKAIDPNERKRDDPLGPGRKLDPEPER